ncbi:MAG: mannose-1-phosphate guanylyltransferase [Deltaproteobacteria bacterium]|nr:mannose-1-phosphate guanylyltransferase [Deltaproteobacteria bacterium]
MLDMPSHRYAVIMAGGAGTRFWPASRRMRPKQFLALGTRTEEAMIQATVRRLRHACPPDRILVATGQHLRAPTAELLPDIPPENILAEPAPRNTAPCIAWATASVLRRDPDAVIAVLSADHLAEDEPAFHATIDHALRVAESGTITTIGIVPTRAETGYGYIETGEARADGALNVARFVEKPDAARAEQMVQSGRFLWNSGFFFYRAAQMMEAIGQCLPALAHGIRQIDEAAARGEEAEALGRIFPGLESISIDYGVMEKLSKLAVVRGSFGWTDVGSWQTLWELSPHDDAGNAAPATAVLVDCKDNLVADLSSAGKRGKVIALIGVQDLAVIETDDALLVMPRNRSQDVRHVVAALPNQGHEDKL